MLWSSGDPTRGHSQRCTLPSSPTPLSLTLSSTQPVPCCSSLQALAASHLHASVPLAWTLPLRCPRGGGLTTSGLCPEVTFSRFCPSSLCKNATASQNQVSLMLLYFSLLSLPPLDMFSILFIVYFFPTRMSLRGQDFYLVIAPVPKWVFGVN